MIRLAVRAIAPVSELAIRAVLAGCVVIDSVPDCFNNAQRDRTTRALVARVLRGCPPRLARCSLISVSRSLRFTDCHLSSVWAHRSPSLGQTKALGSPSDVHRPLLYVPGALLGLVLAAVRERPLRRKAIAVLKTRAHKRYSLFSTSRTRLCRSLQRCKGETGALPASHTQKTEQGPGATHRETPTTQQQPCLRCEEP